MEQKEIVQEAAKALGLGTLVPEVYRDLLQPAVRETGENLVVVAKAVSLALEPLRALVWSYEAAKHQVLTKVTARLSKKPANEIITPNPIISGPIMMQLAFTSEAPHLRELYANLLAAAMHGPAANKAHPSFVHVIQQLTPSEALILQHLANLNTKSPIYAEPANEPRKGNQWIFSQWQILCSKLGIAERALADAYYHNLMRLALLEARSEITRDPLAGWQDIATNHFLRITEYGDLFLDVCVRDLDTPTSQ
jgi:hypothetical protein